MTAVELLVCIGLLGFAACGFAAVARALARPEWLLHKPLSCDLCMSWWPSAVLGLGWFLGLPGIDSPAAVLWNLLPLVLIVCGATGVALLATRLVGRLAP